MGPWLLSTMGRQRVKRCAFCASVTKASKPKPPKHQVANRKWSKPTRDVRGSVCEACRTEGWPCSLVSDAAHVVAKGPHPELRHHPSNQVPLCRRAHDHFGRHPAEWRAWLAVHRPGLLETLQEAAR